MKIMIPHFKILDTTLRDGSYAINYQFDSVDTKNIAGILDQIGFEYIEIGPGVGLNAKKVSLHVPASTDEEYIKAARGVVENGKIGMFCIPGIAGFTDIDMASDNGLDLIRVGTNINEYKNGFKFLEKCKKNGIETASNLMKSYAVNPKEFGKIANICYQAGAGIVYLVDSAGGMLPEDISNYFDEAKQINPEIRLGFHGHDNLGLAVANTLAAINSGVEVVDSSIRGMGRSSGNTITEKLVFVLKRLGYELQYDIDKMLELSDKVILELISDKPEKSLDLIYGFSQFHSSFIGVINKYSNIYNIDPKDLIIEYTKRDKLNISEELTKEIASSLSIKNKEKKDFVVEKEIIKKNSKKEQLKILGKELYSQKNKFSRKVFFNISKTYKSNKSVISPIVHSFNNISFASAEVKDKKEVKEIIDTIDFEIDGLLIDERLGYIEINHKDHEIFYYNDSLLFAKTIYNYLRTISNKTKMNTIFVKERDEIQSVFIDNYTKKYEVVNDIRKAEIAIVGEKINVDNFENLKWVIICKPGVIHRDIIEKYYKSINFIRIDLEFEIIEEISNILSYSFLIGKKFGQKKIDGKTYCSGGYIAPKGAIVVDDISDVKRKYGISNGEGSITYFS